MAKLKLQLFFSIEASYLLLLSIICPEQLLVTLASIQHEESPDPVSINHHKIIEPTLPIFLQIGDECSRVTSSSSIGRFYSEEYTSSSISKEMTLSMEQSTANGSTEELQPKKVSSTAICDPTARLECIKGRCQCRRGFTINQNGTICLEIARNGLESNCNEDVQCWKGLLGRMSECNMITRKCRCYESDNVPIVFHQGRCYYGEILGDYCQIDGLCSATTTNATCTRSGLCQCKPNFVPSWDKSRCLPIAMNGLNSSCEENIQCEKSQLGTLSECNQERMQCQCYHIPQIATIYFAGRCYFTASLLGDVCQVHPQCDTKIQNSYCGTDGKCHCLETEGYSPAYNNTACLKIVPSTSPSPSPATVPAENITTNILVNAAASEEIQSISSGFSFTHPARKYEGSSGGSGSHHKDCTEDSQCTRTFGSFGRCNITKGKCECYISVVGGHGLANDNHANANLTGGGRNSIEMVKCLLGKQLGEPCKYNRQCQAMNSASYCSSIGICECIESSHVPSTDNRKCLPISISTCDEDLQCIKSKLGPLSICSQNGHCECTTLLPVVQFNKTCYFQRWIGSYCIEDAECQASIYGVVNCLNKRCTCPDGFCVEGYNRCIKNDSANKSVSREAAIADAGIVGPTLKELYSSSSSSSAEANCRKKSGGYGFDMVHVNVVSIVFVILVVVLEYAQLTLSCV